LRLRRQPVTRYGACSATCSRTAGSAHDLSKFVR
jgi:hypothetical protein